MSIFIYLKEDLHYLSFLYFVFQLIIKQKSWLSSQTFYGELRQLLRFVKEYYGGVFWKVALSGLLDSAFKETKDQTDANKTLEQDTLTRRLSGKVHRKGTKVTKVERTITYRTKRKFLQKFSRVTTDSSDGSSSLSKLPSVVDSPSLEMALSPRSKRKVRIFL